MLMMRSSLYSLRPRSPNAFNRWEPEFFVDFQSEPFLFTVAHVTDEMASGRLLVPTVDGLSELQGYMAHLDLLPEQSRSHDTVDFAYWRLNSGFAKSMCWNFFPLTSNYEVTARPVELGMLSVVGYPVSKSRRKGNNFSSQLAYYRGMAAERDVYSELGLHLDQNIVVRFHKKNAICPDTGKKVNVPRPRGISGGAIFSWPYGHEFSSDWRLPTLVGIVHSYKENDGIFIGTTLLPYATAIMLGKMKDFGGVE
ncbi:MAG: hypothetical protein Hals2KO_14590 [Halioglobus sp.]